jgi:hypothetical protein
MPKKSEPEKNQFSAQFTHLLKCVFRFKISSIFGWSFPSCSSILDNFLPFLFLSFFSAFSFSCLLCRRLLKNMLTERKSTTVPLVNG